MQYEQKERKRSSLLSSLFPASAHQNNNENNTISNLFFKFERNAEKEKKERFASVRV